MATANNSPQIERQAYAYKVNDFVLKPFDIKTFINLANRYLDKSTKITAEVIN